MKRILVVDDEPSIRRLIQVLLERQRYKVETAADGAQALAKIKESRPDLLVSDVMMPQMDGFELRASIRRDPALMDLPVLLLTAKPFNPTALAADVRRILEDDGGSSGGGGVPAPILPVPPTRPAKDAKKKLEWWEASEA